MPEMRNCRKCGKLYNYIGGNPICPICRQDDEDDFKRVKDYLYDNPGAIITQVSSELDISVDKIKRFLRDGRLEIIGDDANMLLECEKCGKSIKSGRLCGDCERDLSSNLKSTAGQLKQQLGKDTAPGKAIGMRYLNKE